MRGLAVMATSQSGGADQLASCW